MGFGCGGDDATSEDTQPDAGGEADADLPDGPAPYCGDEQCSGDEDCSTCEQDCGPCNQPSCVQELPCDGLSCCAAVDIKGGTFARGRGEDADACPCDLYCNDNELAEHEVTVGAYRLDVF
ncbi:MAG: hypothetical protein ACOC1F_01840, partial [Myxococcota bacterium]